uniref:Uncharacterized protein n=1 Tax=Rhizophora mucronata TaxID=61149 RepID=A0A2P2QX64_RHIMU
MTTIKKLFAYSVEHFFFFSIFAWNEACPKWF